MMDGAMVRLDMVTVYNRFVDHKVIQYKVAM